MSVDPSILSGQLVEMLLAAFLIAIGIVYRRPGRISLVVSQRLLKPLARRPALAIVVAGLLPILLRLLLLTVDPAPIPRVPEEHNILLQADTYAHGRLANPVHPLSVILQSYQVVVWPHYMSARPPLSGIFQFAGQVLTGSAFTGNLIGIGLVSAAFCWMLFGWTSRRWAVLGSALAIFHFCLFGYWINSYWAPSVTVLGGALLLGLVPRLERRPSWGQAVLFVIGLALLLGTRPYEGLVYAAAIAIWVLLRVMQPSRRAALTPLVLRFLPPALVGCVLIVGGQICYNLATTGGLLTMPYQIWRAAQATVPSFMWEPIVVRPLTFYHPGARIFAEWEYLYASSLRGNSAQAWIAALGRHAFTMRDVIGSLMLLPFCWWREGSEIRPQANWLLPLVGLAWVILASLLRSSSLYAVLVEAVVIAALAARGWRQEARLPALLVLVGLVATSFSSFYMTIYLAPYAPAMLLLTVLGLKNLSTCDRVRGTGASLAGLLIVAIPGMTLISTAAFAVGHPLYARAEMSRYDFRPAVQRESLVRLLNQIPGKHLVLVRYDQQPDCAYEFVWNGAAIDDQKIVWGRELKPEWTASAVHYYPDRKVWLLYSRFRGKASLVPYPVSDLPAPAPLDSLPMPDKAAGLDLVGEQVSRAVHD